MKVALAQIESQPADIRANIHTHLRWIAEAASQEADAIFFPELSLSAYEPTLASELRMPLDDPQLDVFQLVSDRHQLTIGLGIPLSDPAGVKIGMAIFQAEQPRRVYAKQILHEDEFPFFIAGNQPLYIEGESRCIAPAICYESLQPQHLLAAIEAGATVYLASVAKSASGVARAHDYFGELARIHAIPILLVNGIGPCDDFVSAGGSAVWNAQGECTGRLAREEEGLLVVEI